MKGILLFGHGARNPGWAAPFHRIREVMMQREPDTPVEMGFLELMRPSFDEAVDGLLGKGVTRVVVVPIFMAAGSHVNKDLPQMAASAMDRHAGLSIELAAPVGEIAAVLATMADYALNATGD